MSSSISPLLSSLRQALAGRFDVVRELGAGGMGQVLLGRDVALDRPVAIKVIAPDLASSPASRQRFLREARTVARLRHPNIVAVYAAGEADNLLYFVMEYVEGESLRQMLDRDGRVEGPRVERAILRAAPALRQSHGPEPTQQPGSIEAGRLTATTSPVCLIRTIELLPRLRT